MSFVDQSVFIPSEEILTLLPRSELEIYEMIPLKKEGNTLFIAISDLSETDWLHRLAKYEMRMVLASSSDIREAILRAYPRTRKNVPGPFYVHTNWCIACQLCVYAAPDLMRYDAGDHTDCYFSKQPATPEEVDQAIDAYSSCCMGAVDYDGTDPDILQRIAEHKLRYPTNR